MVDEDGDQWHRWEDRLRNGAFLLLGLAGAVNELFLRHGEPRVTALAFIATLLGLHFVLPGPNGKSRRGRR